MGQSNIAIDFKQKANTAVSRSARGVACIIVKDTTVEGLHTYTRKQQIKESYADETKKLLDICFDRYGTNKVLVYSIKDADTLENALKVLKKKSFNYMCCDYDLLEDDIKKLKDFAEARFKANKGVIVVTNKTVDSEFFVNVKQSGLKDKEYETSSTHFVVETTMRFAALPLNQSMTNKPLPYVSKCDELDDEDSEADNGYLIVRYDGERYKYGRAVTGLKAIADGKTLDMKKVQIVEGMCLVKGDIASEFETFIGNYDNTDPNRLIFVAEANEYLRQLAKEGVLNPKYNNHLEIDVDAMRNYMESPTDLQGNVKEAHDTSAMSDEEVSIDAEGWTDTTVFVKGFIKFTKAIEDLKLDMYM